jgi:preprotein translocase subunit SecG
MDILASALIRGIITFLFLAICVLLITVILLQKGRGGGLAGAFGGAGGYSAFGAKTGDVFTWITIALTAMFVLVAICGVFAFKPDTATPPAAVAPADSGETGEGGALPAGAPGRAPTNMPVRAPTNAPINVPANAPINAPGATQPAR